MDLPFSPADPALTSALALAFDLDGKVGQAIAALGPVAERDVVLLDGDGGRRQAELESRGARVRAIDGLDVTGLPVATADVIVGFWTRLGLGQAADPATLAHLDRVLRADGRLLLVEDYGRDDTRALVGDPVRDAALIAATDRHGPMLAAGFSVRTLHCHWTFPDLATATRLLEAIFPATADAVVATLRRPRLEHKVAVFHRTRSP